MKVSFGLTFVHLMMFMAGWDGEVRVQSWPVVRAQPNTLWPSSSRVKWLQNSSGQESLMLPQTQSEKTELKKNAKYIKLQFWPNPLLILSKSSGGIIMDNSKWLQQKIKWGINFNIHITWTQDKVKITNLQDYKTNDTNSNFKLHK